MNIFLRFFLRIGSSIVSGSYFGFSTMALIFGIYFASLTGIAALVGTLIWIPACLLFTTIRGIKEENRDQNRRLSLEKLLSDRQETLRQWKEYLGEPPDIPANLLKAPRAPATFSRNIWRKIRPVLEFGRIFATGVRDSAKSIVAVLMITGLLGATAIFTLGPVVFTIVLGICVTLAGAAVIDAYLRRSHQNYQKDLIATIAATEAEIAARKESQLPALPPQNEAMAKVESQLDAILTRESNPHRIPYGTRRKITNKLKYALKLFTGSVNGGYFGFTLFTLAFGVFLPGALMGIVIVKIAALVLAGILTLGYSAENLKREHRDQTSEKAILNELHYNRKKLDALKRLAKQYQFDIPPNPDYLARNKPQLPSETRPTMAKKVLLKINQGLNRFREFFRGAKNSTKLVINFGAATGLLIIGGTLFATSLPLFVAFVSFSIIFGTACAIDYQITAPRARRIEAYRNENCEIQRDIIYYTQKIRELNRTQGPKLKEKFAPAMSIKNVTPDLIPTASPKLKSPKSTPANATNEVTTPSPFWVRKKLPTTPRALISTADLAVPPAKSPQTPLATNSGIPSVIPSIPLVQVTC